MKLSIFALIVSGLALTSCGDANNGSDTMPEVILEYPETRIDNVVDTLFGTPVEDPYRWLEDDNAPETTSWVKAQNAVTRSYLDSLDIRDDIRERYEEIFNYEKVSSPYKVGEYFFFYKNDGLQDQSVIYKQKGRDGEPSVFLDPNTLSEDGTVTVSLMGANEANTFIAVNRSEAGSDWSEIRVMNVVTGEETGDVLKWVKFSGAAWENDGFYYSRYPAPEEGEEFSAVNTFHRIYYHALGTDQSEDRLVYSNDSAPNLYHWCQTTEDNRYLILYASTGTDGYECYYKDIQKENAEFVALFKGFKNKSSVIHHTDGRFLVLTDIDAPKYRLVSIDPKNPVKENWTEILPESESLLQNASTAGGKIFATYLENANSRVYAMDYDGQNKKQIALPDNTGSAGGFGGRENYETIFYSFSSFTYPTSIYEYDIAKDTSTLYYAPELNFNPSDFTSKQVFYKSKDGTEVSMFIVHKKGLKLDGTNPTYLYGYGGFNVSLTPSFSTSNIILLERGGVYAMANLRGGGEYGEEWHKAGMLLKKQNVFDDFIAAAEYLIDEKYTTRSKLAIAGGSNGGLLVGACMTQRPDLFQVAFPAVGVLDMLRYHKFTIGSAWVPEYGNADSSKTDFENLYAYSPYHNLEKGESYPATMITTADHDDRVVPAHSFKFAARLQAYHEGDSPVLIRIEERAGHGAGKPTSKILDEQADKWAFMFANME